MIFDTIVLAVLLISALHAFWRGFIREVLTIFGALGGMFAALAFGNDLRPMMDTWLGVTADGETTKLLDIIPMSLVSGVLAYAGIFIVIFGVLSFLSHLIAEQARALGLGAVDRTLGVAFGLIRAVLILGIFYLPVHLVLDDETKKDWFKTSKTHMYVEAVSAWMETQIPENMIPGGDEKEDKKKDEEKAPDEARKTLEKLDLLTPKNLQRLAPMVEDVLKNTKTGTAADTKPETEAAPEPGYDTPERSKLDALIEEQTAPAHKAP